MLIWYDSFMTRRQYQSWQWRAEAEENIHRHYKSLLVVISHLDTLQSITTSNTGWDLHLLVRRQVVLSQGDHSVGQVERTISHNDKVASLLLLL